MNQRQQSISCVPLLQVSEVPQPVPVIMYQVILVRAAWRWSLPQLEVEGGWNGHLLSKTDGLSIIGVPAFTEVYITDNPLLHQFGGFYQRRKGTALVAHLHQFTGLFHGLYQQLALVGVMAAGFLYIHVFAVVYAQDGGGRMPVVGG